MEEKKVNIREMTMEDFEEVHALWMGIHGFGIRSIDECKGATIEKGLAIIGETAQNHREQTRQSVARWLDKLGFVVTP